MGQGHTWVGFISKPIDIDALKIFDPQRYAPLSGDLDPAHQHTPVQSPDLNALGLVIEQAEEGLVWDILTDIGRLLTSDNAGGLLGDLRPEVLVCGAQSQSGVVLISLLAEGDVPTWRALGQDHLTRPGIGEGPWRREWSVAGASHTELFTPVMPSADEVRRAGRKPRAMTAEQVATGNSFPFEAFVMAALDALVEWVRTGGTLIPLPKETVRERYPTPDAYLGAVTQADAALQAQGYLNDVGRRTLWEAATRLYVRAVSQG